MTELPQEDALRLRGTVPDEDLPPVRLFECARCEAVIYSDEFTFGMFVPPQYRGLVAPILLSNGEVGYSVQTDSAAPSPPDRTEG